MQTSFEEIKKLEQEKFHQDNKRKLLKKGENALYAKLKKMFSNDGLVYGKMKIKDYVEMLKAEIQKEEQTKSK